MIINYSNIPESKRDNIRYVNDKGHVPYIIYMLLKKYPIKEIPTELRAINLSSLRTEQLKDFFDYVLFPLLEENKLSKYYKKYKETGAGEKLDISTTFARSDNDRRSFVVNIVEPTGTGLFFYPEVNRCYRGSIPEYDGSPIINNYGDGGWINILSHDKRFIIDTFLAEGRTSQEIKEHFEMTFNDILSVDDIEAYRSGFLNAPMYNISRVIMGMEDELSDIADNIFNIKHNDDLSYGKRSVMITQLKSKEQFIRQKLKKMKSLHNSGAFATATLEYINMRDILSDILQRSHRRFVSMDIRTDDDVVVSLSRLAGTVDKMTSRILAVDEVAKSIETRTVTEEMIDVISPTLEQLEEEERESIMEWKRILGEGKSEGEQKNGSNSLEEEEIIGF